LTTSTANGRRLVQRAVAWQAIAVAVLALAVLAKGHGWSLAVLIGGGSVALGCHIGQRIALGGGVAPAMGVLSRLVLGLMAKWLVVVALVLAVAVAGLPAAAALAGVVLALAVQLPAMAGLNLNGKNKHGG
jgi:F0F1-type ATP synthase assembly protein I